MSAAPFCPLGAMRIKMDESYFTNPIARHIFWDIQYRHRETGEARDATLVANEPRGRKRHSTPAIR